ncbi:MAG: PAS domain S-box protein, partial [Methanobacterium sp.]
MIESAEGPIFSIDCNYRYTSFNSQHANVMKTIFDVDIEIGGNLLDYHTNPKDRKNAKINIDKVFKGETVIIESFAGDSPQNRRYFSIFHTPIKDSNGKITGAAVYAKDHTEHKEAEEALKKSEAQLKEAQRLSKVGNWEWSIENDIVSWSDELCNIAGLDLERSAPNYEEHPKFYTKESFSLLDMAVKNTLKTGEPYKLLLELIRVDGEHRWVEAQGEVIKNAEGQVIGLRGTVQDINKRKKIEESLKESELKYHSLFENLPLTTNLMRYVLDDEGKVVDWIFEDMNSMTQELLGKSKEQLKGKSLMELMGRNHISSFLPVVNEIRRTGKVTTKESHLEAMDMYHITTFAPLSNELFLTIDQDITKRKKAEEVLNQSQKLLQDIINGFPSPIFVKDTEGRFLTINKKLEELLGVKNEELIGKTDYDVITKELADYYRANDRKVLKEGKAIPIEEEADLIDGHHTFIANKFPIYDSNGKPYG